MNSLPPDVEAALAQLPDLVTTRQIAAATRRKASDVHNWIKSSPAFPTVRGTQGKAHLRSRDEIATWLVEHGPDLSRPSQPKWDGTVVVAARRARPTLTRLGITEMARMLGIERKALYFYMEAGGAACETDLFPSPDVDKRREWAAVRAWLLRWRDPLPPDGPEGQAALRSWVLRNAEERGAAARRHDEHGLTFAQRDAAERARVARAAGRDVDLTWLAEQLEVDGAVLAELETAGGAAPAAARQLGPTALAKELGVSLPRLKYFIHTYTGATSDDPFPAKRERGRDVAEVRDWFTRHGHATLG